MAQRDVGGTQLLFDVPLPHMGSGKVKLSRATSRKKRYASGAQLLISATLPQTNWVAPTELPDLTRFDTVAIDTETKDEGLAADMGPAWHTGCGYVCGVSAAWPGGGIYVPLAHPDTSGCFSREQVGNWLTHLYRSDTTVVMQNAPYDIGWQSTDFGVPSPKRIADTVCAAVMVDENHYAFDLDSLCEWRKIPGKDKTILKEAAAAYGIPEEEAIANLWKLPARYVAQYAIQDTVATLEIWNQLLPIMQKEGTTDAFQVEMDLIPLVYEMRRRGIRINRRRAKDTQTELFAKCERLLDELANRLEIPRKHISINEIRQFKILADWHDRYKIAYPRTNPTEAYKNGIPSFKKEWMSTHEHWLPRLVTKIEQTHTTADKFIGQFILKYAIQDSSGDWRLHPVINQFRSTDDDGKTSGTRSHRISYSDPAEQQAPARDEDMCVAFRGCHEPEEGDLWGSFDFSQQEYKWMVHYAYKIGLDKADEARQRYIDDPNTDFHELVADWTGLDRKQAKNTNFAKAYGSGLKKFAFMTNTLLEIATRIMEQYDTEMPFIKKLYEHCESLAEVRGYIVMKDGARSHFDTWEPCWIPKDVKDAGYKDKKWKSQMAPCSREEAIRRMETQGHPWADPSTNKRLRRGNTRLAMNRLIQGVSARQAKVSMRDCWRAGIVPLIQMHDELNVSCPDEKTGRRVIEIMRESMPMSIPMKVDAEYGINWGHARKVEIKHANGTKEIIYGATWQEAVRKVEESEAA
jgi:DNA polymerase I-like protein with 3'-5' exonuclease and polymerase domains